LTVPECIGRENPSTIFSRGASGFCMPVGNGSFQWRFDNYETHRSCHATLGLPDVENPKFF
jgi:hypothetical protein